jgi:prepilin-type N-terminal cleavage/methylation domain-containing protein
MKDKTRRRGEAVTWRISPSLRVSASPRPAPLRGYTLIEVLIAASIVAAGIAAASVLALTMTTQEESNALAARALNMQEQAGRLYQLGLDPDTITNIIPPEPNVTSLTFTTGTTSPSGVNMEIATNSVVFHTGRGANASTTVSRTNTLVVVRPTTR